MTFILAAILVICFVVDAYKLIFKRYSTTDELIRTGFSAVINLIMYLETIRRCEQ